jgi:hypothetical protein
MSKIGGGTRDLLNDERCFCRIMSRIRIHGEAGAYQNRFRLDVAISSGRWILRVGRDPSSRRPGKYGDDINLGCVGSHELGPDWAGGISCITSIGSWTTIFSIQFHAGVGAHHRNMDFGTTRYNQVLGFGWQGCMLSGSRPAVYDFCLGKQPWRAGPPAWRMLLFVQRCPAFILRQSRVFP